MMVAEWMIPGKFKRNTAQCNSAPAAEQITSSKSLIQAALSDRIGSKNLVFKVGHNLTSAYHFRLILCHFSSCVLGFTDTRLLLILKMQISYS